VPEDFICDTTAVPTPGPGQLLARTIYLSLTLPEGLPEPDGTTEVMAGDAVAQVMESRHPDYRPGEFVVARTGWQQFCLSSGAGLRRLDPAVAPVSTALGALGLPGLKGYVSLVYVGKGRPGQTVLVTRAAGPVGATAAQVARLTGMRAVGIESSGEKCEHAVRELGLAACVSSDGGDLAGGLKEACPEGIDLCIDESGGELLGLIAAQLTRHARLVLCGRAQAYTASAWPAGPVLRALVAQRASVRSFVVEDHLHRLPELIRVVGGWLRAGAFRYREDITEGLAAAPGGFCRLKRGLAFGNALVRVAPERL
jgi:NADPH-dependent curcumin reductase CurA